jgi:hypothetical protein
MTANPERKMLVGTGGSLDYLLVKERDETALSIKPILGGHGKTGALFLTRIRVARLPSVPNKGQEYDWKTIWPELVWAKIDNSRASVEIVSATGLMPWMTEELLAAVPLAVHSTAQFVSEKIGVIDVDDTIEFLTTAWVSDVNSLSDEMNTSKIAGMDPSKTMYVPELFGAPPAHNVGYEVAYVSDAAKKPKFTLITGGKNESDVGIEPSDEDNE